MIAIFILKVVLEKGQKYVDMLVKLRKVSLDSGVDVLVVLYCVVCTEEQAGTG